MRKTLLFLLMLSGLSEEKLDCSSKTHVILSGAGSSFPSHVLKKSGQLYSAVRAKEGSVSLEYTVLNSGYGKQKIMTGGSSPILFAGSESSLSLEEKSTYPNLKTLPLVAGALVVIFNLPGTHSLNLTTSSVAEIFMGKIERWNDPKIQETNPNMILPSEHILPVARLDSADDTQIFTSALSKLNHEWSTKFGSFAEPGFPGGAGCCDSANWPSDTVEYYGNHVSGMIGIVTSIPYTIGYAALPNVEELGADYAALVNSEGVLTVPNTESVKAAMNYYLLLHSDGLEFELSGAQLKHAYPIVSFSYIILNRTTTPGVDCCAMRDLVGFLDWFYFHSAETTIVKNFLSPLSDAVKQRIRDDGLTQITCLDGTYNLFDEYQETLIPDASLSTLTIALIVGATVVGMGGLLTGFLLWFDRKFGLKTDHSWIIDHVQVQLKRKFPSTDDVQLVEEDDVSLGTSIATQNWRDPEVKHGIFDGQTCFLYPLPLVTNPLKWKRRSKNTIRMWKQDILHQNVVQLMGVVQLDALHLYWLSQDAEKGSIHHVLHRTTYPLTPDILFSFAIGAAEGLGYLHKHDIVHGNLSSLTCCLDQKWNPVLTNWGTTELLRIEMEGETPTAAYTNDPEDAMTAIKMLYTDGHQVLNCGGADEECDAFSLGLLILEIFTQQIPYCAELHDDRSPLTVPDILAPKFERGTNLCPRIPDTVPNNSVRFVITSLTKETRSLRRSIRMALRSLIQARPSKLGIVDVLMQNMEIYSEKLAAQVEERTGELVKTTGKMKDLLLEVLPEQIVTKLLVGEVVEPEFYDEVTILFSSVVDFTDLCARSTADMVMLFLDDLCTLFDEILDRFDAQKIDSINDQYMVASGLPKRNGHGHVKAICDLALTLIKECSELSFTNLPAQRLEIQLGIHTGSVTTGVVGSKMPQYCVFGDTVNTASRMNSTSEPLKIQLSEKTRLAIDQHFPSSYEIQYRGMVPVKGKGKMPTYWLVFDRREWLEQLDQVDLISILS